VVLARNLGIVALAAAVVTALGSYGSGALSLLFAVANIAFLVALGWFAYVTWRENRGTFGLMPTGKRYLLYASVVALALLLASGPFWVHGFALAVLFFAAIGGLGFLVWWLWQESRRYYY
jgi:hypothetical protein